MYTQCRYMDTTVQKWGNSLALRIPSALAKDVRLRQGSVVEVVVVEGTMVVKPKDGRRYSLSRLLKGITKANRHVEQPSGRGVGKEAL